MIHTEGQEQCLTTSRQSQHSWPRSYTTLVFVGKKTIFLHSEKEGVDPRATEITGLYCISHWHPHTVQKPCLEH